MYVFDSLPPPQVQGNLTVSRQHRVNYPGAAVRREAATPGFSVFAIVLEEGGATVATVGGAEEGGADVVEPEVGNRTGGEEWNGTPSAGRRADRKKLFISTIQSENR